MRDERDELVLQPVELAQPLVLRREQLLRGLGLGAGRALGDEQEAALLGVLAQAPVLRRQLPGDPVQDREERDVERQQRERQDQREPAARVVDADRDGAVVLVERDRADRVRAALQPHGHEHAQDLQVLLRRARCRRA